MHRISDTTNNEAFTSALTVADLGKAYKQYPTRWARLAEWVLPGKKRRHALKWVLQGLNFTIQSGEAVGIVGVNGAGKSTLLKMIAGTTKPSTGNVILNGRVAALLELGMGFHPEFTGRQNAIMAGQLLGFSLEEIFRIMPEVEAFAEIGDYIDQPVRLYSSGMQMRLAFSVATAQRPDILIVDEALSAGDTYFQHKSFDRIRKFNKKGTTLLIVSHDKQAIQSVCNRAILLNGGKIAIQGEPEAVMDYYNAIIAEKQDGTIEIKQLDNGKAQTTSGTGEARVLEIALVNASGDVTETVGVGDQVELRIKVKVNQSINALVLGYSIRDRLGQVMYGTNTWLTEQVIHNPRVGGEYDYTIVFQANLGVGSYSIQTALVDRDTHMTANYEWRDLAIVFNVVNLDKKRFIGCLWNEPKISIVEYTE